MSEDTEFSITYKQVHMEWKIKNFFSQSKKVNYSIDSPTFSVSLSKWFLRIHPNGTIFHNSKGWVGLFLHKTKSAEECIVSYTIGVKEDDGSELLTRKNKCCNFKMEGESKGYAKCFERSVLESFKDIILDSDGSLIVFCTVRIENTKEVESQTSQSYGIPTLAQDFKRLYLDKRYTDITINVKSKELIAHKCVLAARSKVFAAMFQNEMKEKCSGTLEIDDCDPNSFEDFILYLYTGNLEVVSTTNALSLYKDSDKYDVAELKEECARIMARDLSVESFCDVVHLATMHNESDLLAAATAFFIKNLKSILLSPKWQEFLAENPTLGNELFLKTVDKQENE